ncbi:hypothetical protein SISSUDRAFT_519501 [Sistotremastrum suecicum HHB10207 ss-3]|uniref:Uncharacterized protein n=1 Tax=Sistotremastrum suecicum HHB10207 ss-3 TaxID=1314776 RepID=A0A165XYV1_9AGAM|nr:hypothetical protein SISSUDRAFT_519501 [Sistotremastrum suecicum HHB10207 ss-3]
MCRGIAGGSGTSRKSSRKGKSHVTVALRHVATPSSSLHSLADGFLVMKTLDAVASAIDLFSPTMPTSSDAPSYPLTSEAAAPCFTTPASQHPDVSIPLGTVSC